MQKGQKELDLLDEFERFIRDCRRGRRMQPGGKRLSPGTVANYGYTLQHLQMFSKKKSLRLRIKPAKRLNSRELSGERNYWKKFYSGFTSYLYEDCGCYDNYVGQHIKNIKTFFNYLGKERPYCAVDFHNEFYVPREEIAIYPLMPDELNFLVTGHEFELGLSRIMQEVKDFFVFGCTVALRFSDLNALRKTNIRIVSGQYYLYVRSQKSGLDTLMKLPSYAVNITKKYEMLQGRLLPFFNLSVFNKHLKVLLEMAGYTHPVSITRNRRGRPMDKKISITGCSSRLCDLASSHMMRRTAITTMLSLGVSEQIVRKISGHTPGSRDFYRYVFWSQTVQDSQTEQMFASLPGVRSTVPGWEVRLG